MYRARLDTLPADGPTADAMVEEANCAFSLNTRIFRELDAMSGFVDEVAKVTTSDAIAAPTVSAEALKAAAAGCPFAALAASGVPMPEGHLAFAHGNGQTRIATKAKTQDFSSLPRQDFRRRTWALLVIIACLALVTTAYPELEELVTVQ